jgi:hypothetical protein
MLPVAIGFLADLAGLGGITDKVKEIIGGVRADIDKAIDKIINWVIEKFKSLFGKGDKDGSDDETNGEDADKQKNLNTAVEAGVEAVNNLPGEQVEATDIQPVLNPIKERYGLAELNPVVQDGQWEVHGEIQRTTEPTRKRAKKTVDECKAEGKHGKRGLTVKGGGLAEAKAKIKSNIDKAAATIATKKQELEDTINTLNAVNSQLADPNLAPSDRAALQAESRQYRQDITNLTNDLSAAEGDMAGQNFERKLVDLIKRKIQQEHSGEILYQGLEVICNNCGNVYAEFDLIIRENGKLVGIEAKYNPDAVSADQFEKEAGILPQILGDAEAQMELAVGQIGDVKATLRNKFQNAENTKILNYRTLDGAGNEASKGYIEVGKKP